MTNFECQNIEQKDIKNEKKNAIIFDKTSIYFINKEFE